MNSESLVQLLVPVYNEGENVKVLYNGLLAEGVEFDRLTFVYDLDEDTSLPFIAEISAKDGRVIASKNENGPGVLNALRWGFKAATLGPLIVLMGDNSDKLSIIGSMCKMWSDGACIVSPSRYMPGGKQYGGGFVKAGLSRLAGLSLRLMGFPTADPTNNFKLYDGAWIAQQKIESSGGFEVALELCYKAYLQKRKIVELPTEWRDRVAGESRFRLAKWLPHYLRWYLRCLRLILLRKLSLAS